MADSIQEMWDKFKYVLKDDGFYYGTIILLVGVISFGLGRWSMTTSLEKAVPSAITVTQSASLGTIGNSLNSKIASTSPKNPTQQEKTSNTSIGAQEPITAENATYVGSRKGTKYHLLSCPGAKQISEENKLFFTSKEEAMKSGYSPASNCKGI